MSQAAPGAARAPARPREHALLAWLEAAAAHLPDKTFVHAIDQDRAITFAEMHGMAGRVGAALRTRGIGANDRVALLSGNALEHLIVYLGAMCHGATVCTVQVDMNRAHLGEILRALDAALTLHEGSLGLGGLAAEAPGEWRELGNWDRGEGFFAELAGRSGAPRDPLNAWGDVASIFYTSGTASKPKGVVCTFAELLENVAPTADAFGIGEADRVLDFRSYNWMSAQVLSFLGPLLRGATLYMARRFSQSRYFDWIREFGVTIAACNPTAINMLVNRPIPVSGDELPHLRYITSSSAALMVADWKAFEEMYRIPIAQGCGTSETGWIAGSNERTRRMGSVGRPHAYQNLAIVDEAGNPLPAGEIGAIEMGRHPDNEFRYLAEDGSYRVASKGRARTGDLGYLDEDGYLYITGRGEGPDHPGRHQHRADRDRQSGAADGGSRRGRHHRRPRPDLRRGSRGLRGAEARRRARRSGGAGPLRGVAPPCQAAQAGDSARRAAQDGTRQDGPPGPGRRVARGASGARLRR